jgi:quercetin dioxygenase-like cupin family protein
MPSRFTKAPSVEDRIISGRHASRSDPQISVADTVFVSEACGATGFSTGIFTLQGAAGQPYRAPQCSLAITVLHGHARVVVEGRSYRRAALDSIHIPAGVAYSVRNADARSEMVAHWALGSAYPIQNLEETDFRFDERDLNDPTTDNPESIRRFSKCEVYELAEGAFFCDLFARRFGSIGICGGYGRFMPGTSLPCHIHEYDESITIITGEAVCLVQGNQHRLSGLDTAFVPKRRPHRFLNNSENVMAMLWVYAGDEPDRVVVDVGYCTGSLVLPADFPERI